MSRPVYRKLSGSGYRDSGLLTAGASKCRLWLGEDHLLQVESTMGYRESYKRFYLKDIKAITICRTDRGMKTNILLTVPCLFIALGLFIDEPVVRVLFGILLALPLTGLIVNAAKGPTCKTRLLTAANNWEVPSMNRLRAARKTLDILTPAIQSAQADLERPPSAEAAAASTRSAETEPGTSERIEPASQPSFTNPGET